MHEFVFHYQASTGGVEGKRQGRVASSMGERQTGPPNNPEETPP